MMSRICKFTLPQLVATTGALALSLCSAVSLRAEQPVAAARTAPTRTTMLMEPAVPRPEPAQNNQSTQGNAALKDDLFAGTEKFAKNATEANEVNMDPDSLNLVNGPDAHRAHRTLLNVVHHYEYDKPGMYSMADVDEFRHKLDGPDWHCSIHSRDLKSGESTDICTRRRAPDLIERAIITVEPKELTFIHQISHSNGEGGSLDPAGMPGVGTIPGASAAYFAGISAEMQAQLLASAAELRAEMPGLQQGLEQLHLSNPGWSGLLNGSAPRFNFSPEQQREFQKLQDEFSFKFAPR